jgi:hypothetical protein
VYGRCRRCSDLHSEAFNVRWSVPRQDTSVRWAAAAPLPGPPLPFLPSSSREGQADDTNVSGRRATSPDTEPNRADCLLRRSEHAAEVNAPDPAEIRGEEGECEAPAGEEPAAAPTNDALVANAASAVDGPDRRDELLLDYLIGP